MLKHISIDALQPGMFVSQVIEQTGKFKVRSGGLVKSQAVIAQLRERGIITVEVDYARSKLAKPASVQTQPEPVSPPVAKPAPKPVTPQAMEHADSLYQQAVSLQSNLLKSFNRKDPASAEAAASLSQSIIDSVFDNQHALACLTMIKNADEYFLEHAINCSVLMAIFASHLGYDRDTVDNICLGTLLMDVGMAGLPEELRAAPGNLNDTDRVVIEQHVAQGLEWVEQYDDIPDTALVIIGQHQERVDGSGYPAGLQSEDISIFARMAAIIDTYDELISERPHHKAVAPAVAFKRLTRDNGLDQELVKQFVRCLGVHPVGSMVQLQSGRLGMVMQQNQDDMLKPVVMTFYSINSAHYSEIKRVNLATSQDEIVAAVTPDEFNLNLPKFFREIFLHQMPG